MDKTSELDLTVKDLRDAARALTAAAEHLTTLFSAGTETATDATPAPEAKPVALEQVRAALAEKSRDGHTAKVRELLGRHGANKLSEINPAEYPALLAAAAEIGSTTNPPDRSGGEPGKGDANG